MSVEGRRWQRDHLGFWRSLAASPVLRLYMRRRAPIGPRLHQKNIEIGEPLPPAFVFVHLA